MQGLSIHFAMGGVNGSSGEAPAPQSVTALHTYSGNPADAAYAAMRGVADAVGYVGGGIGGTHRRCIVRRWTPKSGAPRMRPDAAGPRRVECIPGIRGIPTTLYEEKVVGGSAEWMGDAYE